MGILLLWDPELAAAEVKRLAGVDCHSVTVPQHIGNYGQPPWQDPQWDVMWEAICEENTVVNIHIGTGGGVPVPSDQTTYLAYNSMLAIDTMRFTADLLFSPVVIKFPTIKFALSEGGIGWIPFLLERFEDIYSRQRAWTGDDLGDDLSPTDVFRRNFMSCFIRDWVGIELRIGSGSRRSAGRWIIRTPTAAGRMPLNNWRPSLRVVPPTKSRRLRGAMPPASTATTVSSGSAATTAPLPHCATRSPAWTCPRRRSTRDAP